MSTDRRQREQREVGDVPSGEKAENVYRLSDVARIMGKTSEDMSSMLRGGKFGGYVGRNDSGYFLTRKNLERFLGDNGFVFPERQDVT